MSDLGIQPFSYFPEIHHDDRGSFCTTFNLNNFLYNEIDFQVVQSNLSTSHAGVIRGFHYQLKKPQAKLITCISGSVIDVIIDLRKSSKTFLQKFVYKLDSLHMPHVFVPRGFAHGFLSLEDNTKFFYQCDEFYHPEDQYGVIYSEIDWDAVLYEHGIKLQKDFIISDKDKLLPTIDGVVYVGEVFE